MWVSVTTEDKDRLPGQVQWNVGFDRMALVPPAIPDLQEVLAKEYTGALLAWDPVQQKASWKQEPGAPNAGATLSTAGGLVFHGANKTELVASGALTGEDLWAHDTQSSTWAPPMTYALDGEQYIAIAAGLGGGLAAEGGAVVHGWGVGSQSRVLVYTLGASQRLPPPKPDTRQLPVPLPATADAATLRLGLVVYQRHCSNCHGDGLRTGGPTPDLRWASEDVHNSWQDIVIGGALKSRGMVGFSQFLNSGDAAAVRQYVLSQAAILYAQKSSPPQ